MTAATHGASITMEATFAAGSRCSPGCLQIRMVYAAFASFFLAAVACDNRWSTVYPFDEASMRYFILVCLFDVVPTSGGKVSDDSQPMVTLRLGKSPWRASPGYL